MGVGGLALPLTSCGTLELSLLLGCRWASPEAWEQDSWQPLPYSPHTQRERGLCTSPGQDRGAGPGGVRVGKLDPRTWERTRELPPYLTAGCSGQSGRCRAGGLTWVEESWWPELPSCQLPAQLPPRSRTKAVSWPSPMSTSSMNCWYMKGTNLQIPNCSIPTTQHSNRITKRSPSESPFLLVCFALLCFACLVFDFSFIFF